MHYSTLLALASAAYAADHIVKVGDKGLDFNPDTVKAADGDTVSFQFVAGTHSVVQGGFDTPCKNSNGFYSDEVTGDGKKTFTVTVNGTDPVWFYCSVGNHCQSGMVGVINVASSGDKTLAAYKNAAKSSGSSDAPASAQGGQLNQSGSSTASASGSSSSATGTSAASGGASSTSTGSSASQSTGAATGLRAFESVGFAGMLAAVLGWVAL